MALWLEIEDADEYFDARLGASTYWNSATSKTAALTTAQNDITGSGLFTFSDEDLEEPTQAMMNAVCEQALFLLMDPDMELRQSLRAQGVTVAGIVQEHYRPLEANAIILAPRCLIVLAEYVSSSTSSFDWER